MRPIPFEELLTRIFDEYQQNAQSLVFPSNSFTTRKGKLLASSVKPVPLPSAPAAGPHTQLAQNIVTSLTGGRFIELKPSKFLTVWSWKSPVSMPKTSALTPNGLPNLPCLKLG